MKRVIVSAASSLFLILILGGCTFPWEEKRSVDLAAIPEVNNAEDINNDANSSADKANNKKPITEIVFQEKKQINDLKDFIKEAQKIAINEIGSELKLTRVNFSYHPVGDYISYNANFRGDGLFSDGAPKQIFITYNHKYEETDQTDLAWMLMDRDTTPINNEELVGIRCSSPEDCNFLVSDYDLEKNINIEDLKISVVDLVKKYPVETESGSDVLGMILVSKDVLKGLYGHYRFKPATGEVALVEDINETQWFSSDLTINKVDSDEDGISDDDEKNIYKTNPQKADTDGDGYRDGEEIKSGFNPLGSGKLPASAAEKPIDTAKTSSSTATDKVCSTDECYGDLAISQKDDSICNNIIDHAIRGQCLVGVAYKKGNLKPCQVMGNDYPELDDECKELEEEIADENKPVDRDAVTLSDVRIIQTVLELYYNEVGKYPESIVTGSPVVANGNTFISKIPAARKGETDICATDYEYKYAYKNEKDYTLTYCLDHETSKVTAGAHVASPKGID